MRLFFLSGIFYFFTSSLWASNLNVFDDLMYKGQGQDKRAIYASGETVDYYTAMLKKVLPSTVEEIVFSKKLPFNSDAEIHFIEPNHFKLTLSKQQNIFCATDFNKNVCLLFSHETITVGGMSILPPDYYYEHSNSLNDFQKKKSVPYVITKSEINNIMIISYKPSHEYFKRIMEQFQKVLSPEKMAKLKISIFSQYLSHHYIDVCQWFRNNNFPVTAAFFPKIVSTLWPHKQKIYYDPKFFSCSTEGVLTSYFQDFPKKIAFDGTAEIIATDFQFLIKNSISRADEQALKKIASKIPKDEELILYTKETGIRLFYSHEKVSNAIKNIQKRFPQATKPSVSSSLESWKIPQDIIAIDMQEFQKTALDPKTFIYKTMNVIECIILLMHNPDYHLMAMYHAVMDRHCTIGTEGSVTRIERTGPNYGPIDNVVEYFDKVLPFGYKKTTKVTLISSYLSSFFYNLGEYMENKGFRINHIDHFNIFMDTDDINYLDPKTIYYKEGIIYNRQTGEKIAFPRSILFHSSGKIAYDWEWGVSFKKKSKNYKVIKT